MHTVPILILTDGQPTPEQRVAAVHAGAWDFVRSDEGPEACAAKFRIYLQAKRNLDAALGTAPKGVVGRAEFTRRARELGALMARMRGGLACLVTALDASVSDRSASAMVRCARVSDTVGMLGPVEMAILAPATDRTGAVKLAHRIADAVRDADGGRDPLADGGMRIGYEAVANVTYAPIDPVDLLARAAAAARTGVPEAGCKWLRRFDPAAAATAAAARHTPPGVVLDGGRLP